MPPVEQACGFPTLRRAWPVVIGVSVILATAAPWPIGGGAAYALEDSRNIEPAGDPEAKPLEPDQQRELEHLIEDLGDPKLELNRRRRAAAILIHRGWPAATDELERRLVEHTDPSTPRAIAQAVADADDAPSGRLVPPLVDLLETEDADLRADVAAALSRFDDDGLVHRLIDLATDPARPEEARRGAIRALAEHRGREGVDALLEVAGGEAEAGTRRAAFAALARLTGIDDFGDDLDAWQHWWKDARGLPPRQWLTVLIRNLAARNADLTEQLAAMNSRVVAAHHRLYDTTAEANRPDILRQMLEDPMHELRLLALKLIDRRVLNAQSVHDEVRAAMRQRLSDGSAAVRAEVARLLESLADAPAAERVAELLPEETDETVQAAYLTLLARVPQSGAAETALRLIQRSAVRDAAAAFLIAADESDLLPPDQFRQARRVARDQLASAAPSEPALIRLLGQLGAEDDRPLLLQHLGNGEPSTRRAAAEAIADDKWPLGPLLDYLGDETLSAVVIRAVAKRGSDVDVMLKLLDHEPTEADPQARWREAVLAVAGRLNADGVAAVSERMTDRADRPDLLEDILRSAAGLADDGEADDGGASEEARLRRVEAALCLGVLYLREDQPDEAAAVCEHLESFDDLTEDHRRRLAELSEGIQPADLSEAEGSGEGE